MIFNNPELKKNLQLSFSLSKVLTPLLICAITLIACFNTSVPSWRNYLPLNYVIGENIFMWFCTFGFFYSIIMGTFAVVNNFAEEFKQNTWDSIRMTRISSRDLLFGKVLGSTATILISTFFVIIPCLAYSCYLRIYPFKEYLIQDYKITIFMLCLCVSSWVISSYVIAVASYLFIRLYTDSKNVTTLEIPILVVCNFMIGALITQSVDKFLDIHQKWEGYQSNINQNDIQISSTIFMNKPNTSIWFGYELFSFNLITILLTFFTICGCILSLRVIQTHLQIKQKPIYWFIFCAACGIIFSGVESREIASFNLHSGIFFLYCLALVTLITEITHTKKHEGWLNYLIKYDLNNALYSSPLWIRSFFVLFLFIVLNVLICPKWTSILFSLSLIGLTFRDFLAMSFLAKVRSIKFPLFANLLYLIIFYSLFPILISSHSTDNNNLLPQFPNYHSNFSMFAIILLSEVIFWIFMLILQKRRNYLT